MINNNESSKKYTYTIYELMVHSEIFLPELISVNGEGNGSVDLNISYGKMPLNIKEAMQEGRTFHFQKNEMWFTISEVATYYIYNGDTIIIEPYECPDDLNIRIFLLGSAFGMILLQRKVVSIHGSTVAINGQGVVFTGESGAGKSTLTVAFWGKGNAFITDDISAIGKLDDESLVVKPGFPQNKLCGDAMANMGYSVEEYIKINNERDKYAIPASDNFLYQSVPLRAIFELSIGDVDTVKISKITGSEKLRTLLSNIYLADVTEYTGVEPLFFRKCIEIANNVSFYRIVRPKYGFSVEEQIEKISNILAQGGNVNLEEHMD